jgi:desulfoferrodoxin (superoxide reductase-like protein)
MKRASLFGTVLILLAIAGPLLAHPPDSIAVSVDSTRFLSVDVYHSVQSADHYIARISVSLNGKLTITQNFSSQSSEAEQYAYYRLVDAKPGDKVSVTAECNIFGRKTVDYIVPRFD